MDSCDSPLMFASWHGAVCSLFLQVIEGFKPPDSDMSSTSTDAHDVFAAATNAEKATWTAFSAAISHVITATQGMAGKPALDALYTHTDVSGDTTSQDTRRPVHV